MAAIFSWFLIPAAAALAAGSSNWASCNFSTSSRGTASTFSGRSPMASSTSSRTAARGCLMGDRAISMAGAGLASKREAALTDLALLLLLVSVFIPYRPGKMKLLASVHVALAFLATVLFYLAITSLDLKLYFQYPGHFSLCTGLLGFAIAATAALLVLSGFMISSALEFFLTVFAGLWLWLFCRRIRILKRHWL